jgi:hypothetical protein
LPYLALVAAYPIALALGRGTTPSIEASAEPPPSGSPTRARLGVCTVLLALSVALISWETKVEAMPEWVYPGGTPMLTSGTYVMATDLLGHPYDLPRMTFERQQGVLQVSGSFDYMGFRDHLTAFFRPMDLHGIDRAASHPRANLLLFLLALCYAVVGDSSYRSAHVKGVHSGTHHQDTKNTQEHQEGTQEAFAPLRALRALVGAR